MQNKWLIAGPPQFHDIAFVYADEPHRVGDAAVMPLDERGRVWIQPEDGGLRVDALGQQEQVSGAAADLEYAVRGGDPGRVEEAAVGGAGGTSADIERLAFAQSRICSVSSIRSSSGKPRAVEPGSAVNERARIRVFSTAARPPG